MSFNTSIYGCPPPNTIIYTTSTVDATDGIFENLTATNANIANLTTTLFTPVNVNAQNLNAVVATITTADITTANINTENTITSNITTANITAANIDDADIDTIILNETSSVLTDNSVIYRDANQILFIGREDSNTGTGTDFLFYTGLKAGTPKLKISRSNNTIEVIDLNVGNAIETSSIDSGLLLLSDSVLNQDKSRIYREGNVLKIAQGAAPGDADASIHFFIGPPTGTPPLKIDKNNNKTTAIDIASDDLFSLRGTINTFNSTSITSPAISGDDIETQNILWNDKITSNDSYFDRENDVFRFNGSSGATPVDWEFYKTSGINPIVKIEAANDTMTVDGSLVADISQNLTAGTGISLSTASGITTISNTAPVTDPLTLNTLNSTTINNTGTITTNILAGDISGNLSAGAGIGLSTTSGITTISNIAPIPPTLNITTLNSTTINNSGTITTNILNGDISNNLTAGTNITLSTTGGNTTINSSTPDPLIINTLNSTTINNSGTITSSILNGDISGNLTAGTGITLSTVGGNTTINSSTPDPLTINTLNSTTINNSGDINNTTGNINLDVNTGKVFANEFNGSIGRIRSIVSAQNGSYFLTNSTGTGSFAIFSSATGDFYLNTSPSNLNFGSTSPSTGPVAMTIDGTTKDIEIFTDLTTVDITSSGTITATALTADISSNLTGGYGITLNTVGGNTTISSTQGLYMCVTRTGNYAPGGGSTGYVLLYNNISATNGIAYNATTGQATIPFTGLYSISASVNLDNISVNARINIRCRIRINGSWFQGYPQAYGYIRNQNEVTYATATVSDWIVQLTQDDVVDVIAHVGVGTNNAFSSSFLGVQFFNGATFTIRRVDV